MDEDGELAKMLLAEVPAEVREALGMRQCARFPRQEVVGWRGTRGAGHASSGSIGSQNTAQSTGASSRERRTTRTTMGGRDMLKGVGSGMRKAAEGLGSSQEKGATRAVVLL